MADDPIIQMASDPGFAKVPVGVQRQALAAHDPLFNKAPDDVITQFISAHQQPKMAPGTMQRTKGGPVIPPPPVNPQLAAQGYYTSPQAEAQQATRQVLENQEAIKTIPQLQGMRGPSGVGAYPNLAPTAQAYNEYERQSGMEIGSTAGSMAVAPLMAAYAKGAPLAQQLLTAGGRALAQGAGVGGGTLLGGGTPGESLQAGASAAILNPIADIGTAALTRLGKGAINQISKLYGASPERIMELQSLFPKEQALEQGIDQAEQSSRAAFKSTYDSMGIDAAPTNVDAAKSLANNAADEVAKFTGVPRPLRKVAGIPDPAENVLVGDDINTYLDQLKSWDQIPFRDAQRMRTNIEQYISKTNPPTEVYAALKKVSGALGDSLRTTAEREGKLGEYILADSMFQQHSQDFWYRGAPLHDYLPLQRGGKVVAGQEGATIGRLFDMKNQSRVLETLDRRGINTGPIRDILAKGADSVGKTINDAVTLRALGRDVLNQQVAAPVRAAVKDKLIKGAVNAATIGTPLAGLAGAIYEYAKKGRQSGGH